MLACLIQQSIMGQSGKHTSLRNPGSPAAFRSPDLKIKNGHLFVPVPCVHYRGIFAHWLAGFAYVTLTQGEDDGRERGCLALDTSTSLVRKIKVNISK
jgi:hypothetical protein